MTWPRFCKHLGLYAAWEHTHIKQYTILCLYFIRLLERLIVLEGIMFIIYGCLCNKYKSKNIGLKISHISSSACVYHPLNDVRNLFLLCYRSLLSKNGFHIALQINVLCTCSSLLCVIRSFFDRQPSTSFEIKWFLNTKHRRYHPPYRLTLK